MVTKAKDKQSTSLIKLTRNGQITLPADLRKVLSLQEGDYLEAEVIEGKIQLEPLVKADRKKAERQLEEILSRVKYTGPQPMPSADELAAEMADIIHDMRRENAEGGAR
jgi:AbrB family looped-hinge helix DNA binding protein